MDWVVLLGGSHSRGGGGEQTSLSHHVLVSIGEGGSYGIEINGRPPIRQLFVSYSSVVHQLLCLKKIHGVLVDE